MLIVSGKLELKYPQKKLNKHDIPHTAIKEAMDEFNNTHWLSRRFVASQDVDVLRRFYADFERFAGINITKIYKNKNINPHPNQ